MAPFRVELPDADLDDLRDRLARTRWPQQIPGAGWSYGVERDHLTDLVRYWREEYDWRRQETRINAYPQVTCVVDGQRIHLLHVRSPEPDATALIVTHGWPSTVHEYLDVIGPLTDPRAHGGDPADAFHLVLPSVPGFAYSGPTGEAGWGSNRVARAWLALMDALGYDRFGAQGGDFGSIVAPELGRIAPDRVLGVHVDALSNAAVPTDPSDLDRLSPAERTRAQEQEYAWMERSGYATQMSTRPQTVAYALNDSPVGQLAWNLEWYVDWDPTVSTQTPVSRDAILTSVTALWLTGTAGSAARIYREAGAEGWGERPAPSPVPTGVLNLHGVQAIRGLAELSHRVTHWSEHATGGHFAALQAPDLLVEDIRAFFRPLRP
ncbi:epoxide hydrolase [Micromonospora rosaria]|uniref:Epoxide hydrolase n=1 Tax=Micromonospora rosaria TaxID=47874 RepID=A0A136PJL1_9ACTN|nr:epoxide hydrolase [Micromonospora rosaria]